LDLGVAASGGYILSLCGGLGNWRLFSRRPTNERRSKKMISLRSAFTNNPTTHKITIGKPTKSSEEEAEYQIPNSSVCLRHLKIR
jgi:hypothetical protein